jgi:disulfide oxidoreductase YuzD
MTVRVTVFGNPDEEVCLISGCGSRTSSAEAWPETAAALRSLFGEHVTLRYYDLGDATTRAHFPHIIAGAEARGLGFPLVAVNGQIVAGTDQAAPYPLSVERIVMLINDALPTPGMA